MLISMNWIQDFVDLSGQDLDQLIQRFTLSTAEVEEIIHKGRDIEKVVAAQKSCRWRSTRFQKSCTCLRWIPAAGWWTVSAAPPMSGRAWWCPLPAPVAVCVPEKSWKPPCAKAILGGDVLLRSGAGHQRRPFRPDGAAGGYGSRYRHQGSVRHWDTVFEVDNKSMTNRPDLWGHYGIAREFAALAGRPLRPLEKADSTRWESLPAVSIDIQDKELAYRYTGLRGGQCHRKAQPGQYAHPPVLLRQPGH